MDRKDPPPEPPAGAQPCGHLDFGLLVSRPESMGHKCVFFVVVLLLHVRARPQSGRSERTGGSVGLGGPRFAALCPSGGKVRQGVRLERTWAGPTGLESPRISIPSSLGTSRRVWGEGRPGCADEAVRCAGCEWTVGVTLQGGGGGNRDPQRGRVGGCAPPGPSTRSKSGRERAPEPRD